MRFTVGVLVGLVVGMSSACASTVSTVQPARLTPEGHMSLTTSVSANVPVGGTADSLDELIALGDVGGSLDAQEIETASTAAHAITTSPPSADVQFNLAYGVSKRFEIDARVSANSVALGARVQFLRVRPGIYGALGVELAGGFSTLPISRFAERMTVDDYRRFAISIPLVIGYSSSRAHLWAGPKLIFAAHRFSATLCLRETDECADRATASGGGRVVYAAGQFGVAFGKRRFWFALELTVGRVAVDANLDLDVRGSASTVSYSPTGLVMQPAIGLIAWF